MHYKNGREAREGDPVIGESYKGSGKVIAGVLHSTTPGCTTCNAQVAYPIPGGHGNTCTTVGDLYHAADGWALLELQQDAPQAAPATQA